MVKDRIKEVRNDAHMTQEEFASRIGIGKSSVSLLESGRNNPSEQTIRAICEQFKVSRAWLEKGILPKHLHEEDEDIQRITRATEGMNENKKKLMRLLADMPDELLDRFMEYLERKK